MPAKHNRQANVVWLALASQIVKELFSEMLDGARNGNIETPRVNITMVIVMELLKIAQ